MYMFLWRKETAERKLIRWDDGVETILFDDGAAYTEDIWYHAEIESIAGNIIVRIDGTEILSVIDNTFSSGMAGLYCWGNDANRFDNFSVHCANDMSFLDLKVLLEGPFTGTEMTNNLNNNGNIPLSQPYNMPPWNYFGGETVASIPNPDIVDWILIELRDTTQANYATDASVVKRLAAFVLKDGSVVDLGGYSLPTFNTTIDWSLFIVIRHRNHIDVMGAYPATINANIYSYDYTFAQIQVYGGLDGHKELAPNIWGMFTGDSNGDGIINEVDIADYNNQAGTHGYKSEDFNLEGEVMNQDKNDAWYLNLNAESQIPE